MKNTLLIFVLSLLFTACSGQQKKIGASEKTAAAETGVVLVGELPAKAEGLAEAVFAGGCFWCTEAVFERVKGVVDVVSGYTDGEDSTPTYYEVANGETGHTEAIYLWYDPTVVSYQQLVEYFFASHDPTQLNRQGPDVGTQYRSGVYYLDETQATIVRAHVAALEASGKYTQPIVTEIKPYSQFYVAESYHQDYYEDFSNPNQGYVQNVTRPKVEKFMKEYPQALKDKYRKK